MKTKTGNFHPDSQGVYRAQSRRTLLGLLGGVGLLAVLFRLADSLVAPVPMPDVIITEFMAVNDGALQDQDKDNSDWIELTNISEGIVNLEGWFLTDDYKNLHRWKFPRVLLKPGERRVVFASGKNRRAASGELHANFRLSEKGEYLALVAPDGITVAHEYKPKYPEQQLGVSYGFEPVLLRNETRWAAMEEAEHQSYIPSPGKLNREAFEDMAPGVEFSHPRGFHDRGFDLKLRSKSGGGEIRYTLDGSKPTREAGLAYAGPIPIRGVRVVRAAVFQKGRLTKTDDARTYLFAEEIARQSSDGEPPPGFPASWGRNRVDYGMDPRVVEDPRYAARMESSLKSLPSFSLVMDVDDLFGAADGIYANAEYDGREMERPCSLELVYPDGRAGFQINCGVRIRGGFSRSERNPKHAFRFFFRNEYGPAKLEHPLFGVDAAEAFDHFDLRTSQNYSWSFSGDGERGLFLRDMFNRDTQLAMGRPAARGDYYHLYINGQYWGLYNSCERPEASYGASYFGGTKEDYDVIKIKGRKPHERRDAYAVFATDGSLEAWRRLWEQATAGLGDTAAYQRLLGNHPDGTRNPDYEILLDPGNLIDYMLVIFYGGNLDAPVSKFMRNFRPNNWYGMRKRDGSQGFQFFIWDAEHTLLNPDEDRTGPYPAGSWLETSNPQWIWQQCLENEDFRMLAADRIYEHFMGGGVLTPEACRRRFSRRMKEIELAVIAESARWGDVSRGWARRSRRSMWNPPSETGERARPNPFTRDDDWLPEAERVMNDYLSTRTGIVLEQLKELELWPETAPPRIVAELDENENRMRVTIESAQRTTIYYTADGTDPRMAGGDVSLKAERYLKPFYTDPESSILARCVGGAEWSARASFRYSESVDSNRR